MGGVLATLPERRSVATDQAVAAAVAEALANPTNRHSPAAVLAAIAIAAALQGILEKDCAETLGQDLRQAHASNNFGKPCRSDPDGGAAEMGDKSSGGASADAISSEGA